SISAYLSNSNKTVRSACIFIEIPLASSLTLTASLRPLLEAPLMTLDSVRPTLPSCPNPKLSKTGTVTNGVNNGVFVPLSLPSPSPASLLSSSNCLLQNQHHVSLFTTLSFLYNYSPSSTSSSVSHHRQYYTT
ncbi:unnamed protein product, partial [Rotaria sp. Silwood1]